jgi:hypothetical protein
MGCFDTVVAPCPKCGELSGFQTKSGPCLLDEFTLDNAPEDVMRDVNRHSPNTCEKCGTLFGVHANPKELKGYFVADPVDGKEPIQKRVVLTEWNYHTVEWVNGQPPGFEVDPLAE